MPLLADDVFYKCLQCGFTLWHPIARFSCSTLGLYDDDRFPGRCLLALDRHFDDFAVLSPDETLAFAQDAQRAARAIRAATGAERINYAILGNVERHLHFHLIPRIGRTDAIPDKSPWLHPRDAEPLDRQTREHLISRIAAESGE